MQMAQFFYPQVSLQRQRKPFGLKQTSGPRSTAVTVRNLGPDLNRLIIKTYFSKEKSGYWIESDLWHYC